jgi:catechol 2,3-dioxygenase-like lactoylglutathione lyase family enzyme
LAIRVDPEAFKAAVARLTERAIVFGNDPEDTTNGRTDDLLGGGGRAYFRDGEGHLYELVTASAPE